MKKTITFVIGGLLVLGGFTGGVIYKNSTDNEVTSEYNKRNSDESKNNKDKVKVSHERLSEITNAEIGAAGEEAESCNIDEDIIKYFE